jgi:serine/threonine protein kinase
MLTTEAPQRLGQYEITRRLAMGGMAEVFLGKLRGADGFAKDVVIKRILPQHTGNTDFVSMFRDEARITSQLFHGNIVQVIEFGVSEGQHYLVLEYVDGPSLHTALHRLQQRSRLLSFVESVHVAAEVARALDYAHRKRGSDGTPLQVVHRDVTPSNILLSHEGEVKLADFGIARARARLATTAAGSGIVKGKLPFMAPEAIQSATANAMTDVFSLGAVLYSMLTGVTPFRGESETQTVARVLSHTPPPPSQHNPDVPAELDDIVGMLLSKDPEKRPQRALFVADALSRFIPVGSSPAEMLAATLASLEAQTPPTTPQRLLIVHESRTVRAVLRAKLEPHFSVEEAGSTREALDRASASDIVLCQRTLGGAPDSNLGRRIRAGSSPEKTKIVVVASQDTQEVRALAQAGGADAVATPAMPTDALLALLKRVAQA